MLTNISYFLILGKPLIMYLGIIVLACFISTAFIGRAVLKGNADIKFHMLMVKISFTIAAIHAVLGVLAFF